MATAEPAHWTTMLETVGLFPIMREGRAEFVISASDLKWKGIRFQEFVVGATVGREKDAAEPDGFFMAYAFHSLRLFAWMERTFFKTPHQLARIDVAHEPAAVIKAHGNESPLISATMGRTPDPMSPENPDGWDWPIYLPTPNVRNQRKRRVFYARATGNTRIIPFDPGRDSIVIATETPGNPLSSLATCGLEGHEWHIRGDAVHARTKTISERF